MFIFRFKELLTKYIMHNFSIELIQANVLNQIFPHIILKLINNI